jgi:glycosyltransferase involved in cell wall biosynthesis
MTDPAFTVVIPATRENSLPGAIASVQKQTVSDWELIVVGQGAENSIRSTVMRLQAADRRLRYVNIPTAGQSKARNAGLAEARGRWVAMMDDDCRAAPNWLEVLSASIATNPTVGLIGGSMLAPPKPAGRGYGRCPHWDPPESLYEPASGNSIPFGFGIVGGNFAIQRDLTSRIGAFDECFGVGGDFPAAEDTDYLWRAISAGARTLTTPRAIVHHSDGWRYGYRTVLRHQRQRGLGNGALAAKRAMAGDDRGRRERDELMARFQSDLLRLHRPEGIWYLPNFLLGYRRCIRHYELDRAGLLRRRRNDAVPSVVSSLESGR